MLVGSFPTGTDELANFTDFVAVVMVKGKESDIPPPGAGLKTVIEAVPKDAMLAAGTSAVSLLKLTNVVLRGIPFQFTTEVGTKPVPFTVRVNSPAPGAMLVGPRGWWRNGIGFVV